MYVVTGGGTGIGRAVALSLHHRGEAVLVAGRRRAPLDDVVARTGGAVTAVSCDLATPDGARTLAAQVAGRVDGLVHCAGGNPAIGTPEAATLDAEADLLRDTLDSNLTSAALAVSALSGHLAAGAAIVLFGSIAAEHGVGFYGPAKAAVSSYALGLAAALGPRGIRVNCISPGYIADTEFFAGTMTPEREEELRAATTLGRTGVPDDVVGLTEFLLSSRAQHLTGQNLHVDGGAHPTR
ncbi:MULTISPECIES: SDR family NAD(P)-dependent oxidoreductase [Prauserella salsuginis group]|uniref:SDR family NAD(P)-dependent oxidoreductase n=1 Tax=Prauserella salsuginis TaxID=387889 RepID=A0ABW6G9T2_9PSEU|nr:MULTISPECIES: SDR family oxidoreductase [Prauserella salsuginis group]MCR3721458.1 3-oxoacyl-[acyl-carrier protein] reductase [Prauserella flava]MCR3732448.1 3-oxoacyl-[acyl-carrier protein] reductase [Prauserella salsuginis]